MKSPPQFIALTLLLCLAGGLSSCATHPCSGGDGKRNPKNFEFSQFQAKTHVYPVAVTRPAGAPILVMHGLCGLDGPTIDWAQELSQVGWQVYLPMLDSDFDQCNPVAHSLRMKRSGIWKTSDPNASGQVLDDMGALADAISAQHGDRRLVVVGNCLTGSFPLAMLPRPSVKTAVLCQPALPLKSPLQVFFRIPQSAEKRRALAISPEQLDRSLRALHQPSKRLYGFHYLEDPLSSMDKFVALHEELERQGIGWKFKPVVLVPASTRHVPDWWTRRNTSLQKGRIVPHVTITGGEEVDRTPLRKLFNRMIRPNS